MIRRGNAYVEPSLDKSVPKDHIAAMLGSLFVGLAAGFAATYFAFGTKEWTVFTAGYALFGALEGSFDLTRRNVISWIPIIVVTALLPLGFQHFQVCREAFAGGIACIVAGVVMTIYHRAWRER